MRNAKEKNTKLKLRRKLDQLEHGQFGKNSKKIWEKILNAELKSLVWEK